MARTVKVGVLLLVLLVALGASASAAARLTTAGAFAEGTTFLISLEGADSLDVNLAFDFFNKQGLDGAVNESKAASYFGLLRPWEGFAASVGIATYSHIRWLDGPPRNTLLEDRQLSLRADIRFASGPVDAVVDLSSAGIDYRFGVSWQATPGVAPYIAWYSWPGYYSGVLAGMRFGW